MIVSTIVISFSKGSAPDLIAHMVEDGREYCFIPDCDLPAECGADIEIVKPDGLFVIEHCTIDNNRIVVPIPEQATTVRGMAHYIIKVKQADEAVIFSASGTIWVDDGLITDDMLESIAQVYGLKFPDDFLTTADLTDYVTIQDLEAALQPYALSADIPEIEANPAGTASTTLNKLRINNDIFSMPDPLHIYSTTEHIIGKWIDGSTLYEKTIEVAQPLTAGGDNLIPININNFGKLINVHGSATCAGIPNLLIPMMSSSLISYIINPYSVDANGYLHLEVGTIYTGNNILQDVIITLQYIKTSN